MSDIYTIIRSVEIGEGSVEIYRGFTHRPLYKPTLRSLYQSADVHSFRDQLTHTSQTSGKINRSHSMSDCSFCNILHNRKL